MATLSRLVVLLETNTAQFDRGFQNASQTVERFGQRAEGGGKGVTMMTKAIETLAFQAAGLEGPVGKLGQGLLMFGVGGLYTTAFLAGFVAMRKAMELWESDATERLERVGALSMKALQSIRTPEEDALVDVLSARTNLKDARAGLAGAGTVPQAERTLKIFEDRLNNIRMFDELERKNTAAFYADLLSGQRGPLASSGLSTTERSGTLVGMMNSGGISTAIRGTSRLGMVRGLNEAAIRNAPDAIKEKSDTAIQALSALSGSIALLGAVTGRTGNAFGQFLVGAGGIAGAFGGPGKAIGLGLGIFGEFINLFGGHKSLPVRDDALLAEMKKGRTGPDSISINVISPSGQVTEQFYLDARKRSRRDAISRVPIYLPA